MIVETYPLGSLQANCYLIWKDNHVLIVDPGSSSKRIANMIKERNGVVDAVLLTHGHYDHFGGIDFFYKEFHCPIYLSSEDESFLKDSRLNCSIMYGEGTTNLSVEFYDPTMHVGAFDFDVMEAPGHTNGCVLLIFDTFVCTGDVLFKGSIGRCDFPTGSTNKMNQSLSQIKQMNPNLIVYPGHGEATTIQEELLENPYLK